MIKQSDSKRIFDKKTHVPQDDGLVLKSDSLTIARVEEHCIMLIFFEEIIEYYRHT